MTGPGSEEYEGLPADVARLLAAAPVTDKQLLELRLTWDGLPAGQARMAGALRVFVITWDPLEHSAPRPDAIPAVNGGSPAAFYAGSPAVEIAVYLPLWRLTALAADRSEPVAATVSAIGGSAIVTAAAHERVVLAGRYPALFARREVPDLLLDMRAGEALGQASIAGNPPSWRDIGQDALLDVIQDEFGPVDLDRSPVELLTLFIAEESCPACAGQRFAFPGELEQSRERMCSEHRGHADKVISERTRRAERSNPKGWSALQDARARLERPHLPNGLATTMADGADALDGEPDPAALAEVARATVEAAEWFTGRGDQLGGALGLGPESGTRLPSWLLVFPLALGNAGLAAEAVSFVEALERIVPDTRPSLDVVLAIALAKAGDADGARAQAAANVRAWPDDIVTWSLAADTLEELGDLAGAREHLEAALKLADRQNQTEQSQAISDQLTALRLTRGPTARLFDRAIAGTHYARWRASRHDREG